MKKNKIIFIINNHLFTAKHRLPFIKSLQSQGFILKVIVADNTEASYEFSKNGITVINWALSRSGLGIFSNLRSLKNLYLILKNESPDLIINATAKPIIFGTFVSIVLKKIQVLNLVTGLGSVFIGKTLKNLLLKFIVKLLYKIIFNLKPQTIVFQNSYDEQQILGLKKYKTLRSVLIKGSGVETLNFKKTSFPKKLRVVFVGRLIKEKGIECFIEAANQIIKKRSDIIFTLVGPIDRGNPSYISEKYVKKISKNKNIEWLGKQKDIKKIYSISSIVVLPSLREGLPKVLLEAGLSAKPVIASNVPGCSDVVVENKTGYLFPVNNSSMLARKILSIIDDRNKMKKMGLQGREYIKKTFSTDVIIPQLVCEAQKTMNVKNELI